MATTQTYVDARVVRELAAELGLDCEITVDGDWIVIDVCGTVEHCSTLGDACQAVREHAKS